MACLDCQKCHGKAPLLNESNAPEQIEKRIIFQIETIVRQQNAGTLNLESLDYWEWRLLEIYREAEAEMERQHKTRIRLIFEAMPKQ